MRVGRVARVALACGLLAAAAACGRAPESVSARFDPDSIPSAFARPSAGLMWPGATRGWQVTGAGDLFNGEWTVRVRPASDGAVAAPPRAIAYEDRWLPVAHWSRHGAEMDWRFEAAAFPQPGPRDSGEVVSLRVEATNRGSTARSARLTLALATPDSNPIFVAYDAPESPSPPLRWGAGGRDTIYAWSDHATADTTLAVEWALAPGASRSLRVLLPAYPTPASELRRLAGPAHERRVAEVRDHWTRTLDRATRFDLGDPEVESALKAARVLLLSCRERRGSLWVPIGGPFHYRDVWLRDGARLIAALAVSGHTREARELARGFMLFQWPQGAFLSQRGQPDGTGQALWAFEQAMLRPAPAESLGLYADAAARAWRWLEWQRDFGREAGWRFGVMLPFADPRDAELVQAQMVGTDAWALAGYRAAGRLLRVAGREVEAAEVERTRERYRADFEAALARTRSRDVPPTWQEIGRDWGNLAVGWPCGALPPEHPRLAALARRVWSEAGGAGLVTYGHRDSLHGYVGADLGTWALLAGRRDQADSVLAALLHWRDASGAGAELFSRAGDFGRNLPPHPTSAAAVVALVRNALVYDDGDTLQLTLGARERWWHAARVSRAPTRWGLLDLEFRRDAGAASWKWTAVPVWSALTLPPGTRLASAPAAPLVAGPSGAVVLAPPGTTTAQVTVTGAGPAP